MITREGVHTSACLIPQKGVGFRIIGVFCFPPPSRLLGVVGFSPALLPLSSERVGLGSVLLPPASAWKGGGGAR